MKIYGKDVRNWTGSEDLQWMPVKDLLKVHNRRSCGASVNRLVRTLNDRGIDTPIVSFETNMGIQGLRAVSSENIYMVLLILKPTPRMVRLNPECMNIWKANWIELVEENQGAKSIGFAELSNI